MVTWLRGSWYTDVNGVVEVTAIYFGHYTDRAPLVHIIIHKDWVQSENGLYMSFAQSQRTWTYH